MIRLLIVDDHPSCGRAWPDCSRTSPDSRWSARPPTESRRCGVAAATRPTSCSWTCGCRGVGGVEATARIAAAGDAKVLDPHDLRVRRPDPRRDRGGASGYLLKAAPQAEIVAGIRSVAAGQTALSPHVAVAPGRADAGTGAEPCSPRARRRCCSLVAAGNSNKQIAVALGIGESTVKTHLLKVFEKLGVADRTRAVTLAMERGLLRTSLDDDRIGPR